MWKMLIYLDRNGKFNFPSKCDGKTELYSVTKAQINSIFMPVDTTASIKARFFHKHY